MTTTSKSLTFGYKKPDLDRAFTAVQHPKDWKLANRAVINAKDYDLTEAAVEFFTGGGIADVKKLPKGKMEITFAGYYVHVGS